MRARDLMKPDPLTLRPDASFLEILHLFVEAQIDGAPVVDEHGAVRGMISRADLLAVIDQACDEDIDPGEDDEPLVDRLDALTAVDLATPEVEWVTPDTPISEVVARMRKLGIQRVLVGTDGRLAGIVTAFDLLRAVRS